MDRLTCRSTGSWISLWTLTISNLKLSGVLEYQYRNIDRRNLRTGVSASWNSRIRDSELSLITGSLDLGT